MKQLLSKNYELSYSPAVYLNEIWNIEADETYVRSYLRYDSNDISIYKDADILVALRTYEGEGRIILEDKEYNFPADSIFIFKIEQPRKYWTHGKKWCFFWVEFKTTDLPLPLNYPQKIIPPQYEMSILKQCYSILSQAIYSRLAAAQFAMLLTDYSLQMGPMPFLNTPYFESITTFIASNYQNPKLNVDMIAQAIGFSNRQLYNIFIKLFHSSPQEYIRKYRLKISLALLEDENLNISEVAYSCGFNNQYYFSYAFKKEFKTPPSEYRKQKHIIIENKTLKS